MNSDHRSFFKTKRQITFSCIEIKSKMWNKWPAITLCYSFYMFLWFYFHERKCHLMLIFLKFIFVLHFQPLTVKIICILMQTNEPLEEGSTPTLSKVLRAKIYHNFIGPVCFMERKWMPIHHPSKSNIKKVKVSHPHLHHLFNYISFIGIHFTMNFCNSIPYKQIGI